MLRKGTNAVKKYPDGRPDQFFYVLGAILEPFGGLLEALGQPKSAKKQSETRLENHVFSEASKKLFFEVLGAKMEPKQQQNL